MKRKFICGIVMIIAAACLISCGNKADKESSTEASADQVIDSKDVENEAPEDNKDVDSKSNNSGDKKTNKKEESNVSTNSGKKQKYKAKLDDIEKGLSDLDSYRSGNTNEMKYAASQEYERWDNALNEIYGVLKNDLSKDKMSALEKEENKWIKEKEAKAKKEAEEYKGGTAEGLQYTASLAKSTKSRCYELVDKYMK